MGMVITLLFAVTLSVGVNFKIESWFIYLVLVAMAAGTGWYEWNYVLNPAYLPNQPWDGLARAILAASGGWVAGTGVCTVFQAITARRRSCSQ